MEVSAEERFVCGCAHCLKKTEEEEEARSGSSTNQLPALKQEATGGLDYDSQHPTALLLAGSVQLQWSPEKPKPPKISSMFSTVDLGCPLDLKRIAQTTWNVEYTLKSRSKLIMRIRRPRSTAIIYSTGKMACMGTKSTTQARVATRKFARILQKAGMPVCFMNFRVENMTGCGSTFPVNLQQLALSKEGCSYQPEIFQGLHYKVAPHIVATIFSSGKVNLTGCKNEAQVSKAFNHVWDLLSGFRSFSGWTQEPWPQFILSK